MERYVLLLEIAPEFAILGNPPVGLVNTGYEYAFSTQGGEAPVVWSLLEALPSGWTLSPSGLLEHVLDLATPEMFDVALRATDAAMVSVEKKFSIRVVEPLP